MDASDRGEGDDRTFRVSFTGEGAARLRERVKEKLSEFMGDYTDDTLVEYVVVLLRNGRHKDEARKELHVFLGDDSFSFISWLWDHLSSNLHLYVQPGEPLPDEAAQRKPKLHELSGRRSSQTEHSSGKMQTDSKYEREKSAKIFRSRRNREWKGLVQEPELFPLQSTVTENVHLEEKTHRRASIVRRSPSPRPWLDRKRGKGDEQPPKNSQQRDTASLPVVDAPRRLLQFAVRDAVRTVQQPSSRAEPGLKRLRSVVSASTADNVENERPKRTRSVSKVPTAVSTAIKAAAEAAEDVSKVRYSGNVFDRLGHGMGATETVNQSLDCRAPVMEDEEDEHVDQMAGSDQINYCQRNEYEGELTGNMTMLGRDAVMAIDSASDNDGYDSVDIVRHRGFDSSETATSANKDKNSLMVQYSVAQDVDKGVRKTRSIGQNPPDNGAAKSSSKIVNISVNVNTWKPPHYQESRDVALVENRMAVDKNEGTAGKSHVILKESNTPMPEKEKEITRAGIQKDSQKTMVSAPGSYATGRPSEDVDSRTIFVSNVHFAATKDTLSRHFNKFGEVLKVVIVTDAATGQPTGSAYVEFLRKESAELALSLNGTSFMSRILKVVRSSAHHEATALMGWPRIARAAPFSSRLGRVPYPRGMLASAFRARLPIKTGARSLQWKREAAATQTSNGAKGIQNAPVSSGNSVISSTGRNLTYIRTESKADGNAAPA